MNIRYKSKKDAWLIGIIVIAFLISLISLVLTFITPGALQQGGWVSVVVVVVVWAFVASLIWPLYYEITPSDLIVRGGLLHWEIPLSSIQQVLPTHNMLASPALSLDRLRIEYSQKDKTRFMLISPKDKSGFLRNLAQNAGDFELRDDGIVRLV
jgi:Bacterial PH domain